jgi:hypothetical protein
MNNLLAKYSNKTQPRPTPSAPTPQQATVEKPVTVLAPPQPARKTRQTPPGVVPSPVHTCDVKTTRTQLELLRETSNLNAAHAIRTASSRRRRKNLLRGGLFSIAAVVIYAIKVFFID